jgi:hypothetical protein
MSNYLKHKPGSIEESVDKDASATIEKDTG